MAIQRINLGAAPSGTGGDTNRSAFKKIDDNFVDSANAASRLVGTAAGNVMEVGAFGLGSDAATNVKDYNDPPLINAYTKITNSSLFGIQSVWQRNGTGFQILTGLDDKRLRYRHNYAGAAWTDYFIHTTQNTSVDPNGFLKAASPIVSLYADKIELNDEAKLQDINFEKLGVGDYLIKGSLGFAQEGWYIEMPKDANGNVLVAVVYEQLDNNDISVKTYAKKFDEETGDVVANTAKPRDIPSTRWIDLRLQALPQTNPQPFNTDETVATNAE